MAQYDQTALDTASFFSFSMGTLTPAATAAASAVEQSFPVPAGTPALKTTDMVSVYAPNSGNNVAVVSARVVDATHIAIKFLNPTAGSLTHAAGVFTIGIERL